MLDSKSTGEANYVFIFIYCEFYLSAHVSGNVLTL